MIKDLGLPCTISSRDKARCSKGAHSCADADGGRAGSYSARREGNPGSTQLKSGHVGVCDVAGARVEGGRLDLRLGKVEAQSIKEVAVLQVPVSVRLHIGKVLSQCCSI